MRSRAALSLKSPGTSMRKRGKNSRYGKVERGDTLPYGTLADASYELRKAYYTCGYLHDKDMPELPELSIDDEYVDPIEELHKGEMVIAVQELLDGITPRERKILHMRFGIGLTQEYTLEEIAPMFEVTPARIRQIEVKAMRKAKHPERMDKLRNLMGYHQTTEEKENEHKKVQMEWEKARKSVRLRDEAQARAKVDADLAVTKMVVDADRELRKKWDEIKPMVSDIDWVAHLKIDNPAMYQELKYMVGDIWGKNAREVWEMYAQKK